MRLLGNNLLDGYIHQLPDYVNTGDDAGSKAVKSKERDKFMAVLFLRNAHHEICCDLLVEYRKAFVAKGV